MPDRQPDNGVVFTLNFPDVSSKRPLDSVCTGFVHRFVRRRVSGNLLVRHRENLYLCLFCKCNRLFIRQPDQCHARENRMCPSLDGTNHVRCLCMRLRLAENFSFHCNDCIGSDDNRITLQAATFPRTVETRICQQASIMFFPVTEHLIRDVRCFLNRKFFYYFRWFLRRRVLFFPAWNHDRIKSDLLQELEPSRRPGSQDNRHFPHLLSP